MMAVRFMPILIDLTTTESELVDTQIEIVVPTEPEGEALDYIVDVATTKRSLNNGPDIARHCIQQGQTSVNLNNLPLNGTNIYIRVWSKKVNGDWVYEDYELETEAKTPITKQVTRSYIVSDHLQTPRFIFDDEKALTWRWASDGFGRQAANDDPDDDGYQVNFNLGFPGQYDDLESGLVYNWNRYYDSEIGRYVTSDPIGLDGGLNTFGYVLGNPLIFMDPRGEDGITAPAIGGFCAANPHICGPAAAAAAASATTVACGAGLAALVWPSKILVPSCEAEGNGACAAENVSAMANRNQGDVGHDYVREMARGEGGNYCDVLKDIMQSADKKSKLFRDAKATWKKDCRGKR